MPATRTTHLRLLGAVMADPDDTPPVTAPKLGARDALGVVLGQMDARLDGLDGRVAENTAAVQRLSAAQEALAKVIADREERALRHDTAEQGVAVARWGALTGLVDGVRACATNPVVLAVVMPIVGAVASAVVYWLYQRLGVPAPPPTIPGVSP